MTPKEILIAARAKIAKPENWTQWASARDVYGQPCAVLSDDAYCWCSSGAVTAAFGGNPSIKAFWEARRLLFKATQSGIPAYNDTHTHAEVLAKFDEAIGAAS